MATWDGLGQITRKVQSGIYSSIAVQSGIQSCIPQEKRWNDVMAGREQERIDSGRLESPQGKRTCIGEKMRFSQCLDRHVDWAEPHHLTV